MQPVHLGNGEYYPLQELTLGHAIKIAECTQHERKLTLFLQGVLGHDVLPYQMDAQQRHYTLLHYFNEHGEQFEGINIPDLMLHQDYVDSVEVNGMTFRHLNGFECEAIEQLAKNRKDYILMSLVLTVGHELLPDIIPCSQVEYAKQIIQGRLETLQNLSIQTGVELLESYYMAQDQLSYLLNLTFDDNGIVIYGETQDCPMRFSPFSAMPTIITDLFAKAVD